MVVFKIQILEIIEENLVIVNSKKDKEGRNTLFYKNKNREELVRISVRYINVRKTRISGNQ